MAGTKAQKAGFEVRSSCGKFYAFPRCQSCKEQYTHHPWYTLDICNECFKREQQGRFNMRALQLAYERRWEDFK
jgi:hypothetical protein